MQLGTREFNRLAALIEGHCGIKMPASKQLMVEGRLQRRARTLGLGDVAAYCRFIFDEGGMEQEFVHLIDVVTTNKTDFFREPDHFDFLLQHAVPDLMQAFGSGVERPFVAWSAACSTGQEPYSIAMVLAEAAAEHRGFGHLVRATDISTEVLRAALRGVYAADLAEPIPPPLRRRHVLRARDGAPLVRVAPELRERVCFRRMNLLDGDYPWPEQADVTFCRNVLIYFDRPTQQKVLEFLCAHLRPGGYLFLGHSETLTGVTLPLRGVAPAVYRRI